MVEDYVPVYSQKQSVKFSGILSGPDAEIGIWMDVLQPAGAEVLATYSSGNYAGRAAITMNSFGKGKAMYIGGDLNAESLARVLPTLAAQSGIKPSLEVPSGVEMTVRASGERQWIFLLNHTAALQTINIPKPFTDLLTGEAHNGNLGLSAYGVRVLQAS
jgi:beta-galactosidase